MSVSLVFLVDSTRMISPLVSLSFLSALRSASGPSDGLAGGCEEDALLDGLVRAATVQTEPRERRKARQFNRKSCKHTHTQLLSQWSHVVYVSWSSQ